MAPGVLCIGGPRARNVDKKFDGEGGIMHPSTRAVLEQLSRESVNAKFLSTS